ncbi:hypothetical protein H0H87_004860 [Tephrocybe sp. NHM501043]|nr:hypothetical protein H0H87_004860 [Tephrocybe sp. NHM501043]
MTPPALFIYTPRCIDEEVQIPLSPTSSVKGLFTQSRPVSFAPSECPTLSAYASDSSDQSDVATPATSTTDDALCTSFKRPQAPESQTPRLVTEDEYYWRLSQPTSMPEDEFYARFSRELSISVSAASSRRVRIVRRSDVHLYQAEAALNSSALPSGHSEASRLQKQEEDTELDTRGDSKNRGWKAVRRTVSQIFGRQTKHMGISNIAPLSPSPSDYHGTSISSPPTLKSYKSTFLKSSSASLFSRRSRRSVKHLITTTPAPQTFDEQKASSRRQNLRRSRSFSGFPNLLTAIADEGVIEETDVELDEVTVEAQRLARDIGNVWMFTPASIADDSVIGGEQPLFERGVEML